MVAVVVVVVVVVYLSICLSVCLSIYLSVYLSICLSVYLSTCKLEKKKLSYETSSIFDLDNVKNEAILRDFLNF